MDTPDFTEVVVPVSGMKHAVAVDFDPVDKMLYWSDDEKLEIKRSKLDGTGIIYNKHQLAETRCEQLPIAVMLPKFQERWQINPNACVT